MRRMLWIHARKAYAMRQPKPRQYHLEDVFWKQSHLISIGNTDRFTLYTSYRAFVFCSYDSDRFIEYFEQSVARKPRAERFVNGKLRCFEYKFYTVFIYS